MKCHTWAMDWVKDQCREYRKHLFSALEDKVDGLIDVLRPFGIIEMARTGRVAMARGANAAMATQTCREDAASEPEKVYRAVGD